MCDAPMKWKTRHMAVFAAVLSLLLQSCVLDDNACPQDEGRHEAPVMLSLVVTSQSAVIPGTRAEGHKPEEALEEENYIDLDDYRVMIFDGNGYFLQNFDATERRISATNSQTGSYSIALSGPLTVSTGEIQVLVLVNQKGFGDYPELSSDALLTELYTDDTGNIFTMPVVNAENTPTSWRPQVATGGGIPMFGVSEVKPLLAARDATDGDKINGKKVDGKVLDMGEIMLLRALSKIEVMFDSDADGEDGLTISNVSLSAYNTTGRFIPDVMFNLNWDALNTQVVAPTLPADVQLSETPLQFFQLSDNVWHAYVPEMDLTSNRPDLTISIKNAATGVAVPFIVPLDNPIKPDDLAYLLRNHIYRYTIAEVDLNSSIDVVLDVVPYDETVLDPSFGKDNDELEADGRPYEDKDLNPGFGTLDEEADGNG